LTISTQCVIEVDVVPSSKCEGVRGSEGVGTVEGRIRSFSFGQKIHIYNR